MKNFPGNFLSVAGIVAIVVLITSFGFNLRNNSNTTPLDENRIVAPFDEVNIAGSFEVRITQGAQTPIKVVGKEEDVKNVITEVKDNTLYIKPDNNGNKNYNMGKVIIEFSVPELYKIESAGSCVINCKGTFGGGKDVECSISGSGTIAIDVNANELEAEIAGSGEMTIGGKANEVEIEISGSGNFKGENLNANNAEVSISGSGSVYINTQSTLKAEISGSGNILYGGNPKVDASISGSGKVHAK